LGTEFPRFAGCERWAGGRGSIQVLSIVETFPIVKPKEWRRSITVSTEKKSHATIPAAWPRSKPK
jgi:hypothetical protein